MRSLAFCLFDTPLGQCGIVWSPQGVAGVHLPESTDRGTRSSLQRRFPRAEESAPPPEVQRVVEEVIQLLSGGTADLSRVTLDMTGVAPFHQQVLKAARDIPCGTTISYGELARRVGSPGAARAVGRALGQNPFPIIVPCHRVLTSDGRTGGFSASGGAATKLRLLALEGARLV